MAEKVKRRFVRFDPDPTDTALVEFSPTGKAFKPTLAAIISNEAYGGCGLVLITRQRIKEGDKIRVKVGRIKPLIGVVAWVDPLAPRIIQIGVRYEE